MPQRRLADNFEFPTQADFVLKLVLLDANNRAS